MTQNKDNAKILKKQKLRNNEYYNMQDIFDDLYSRSKENHNFYKLYEEIIREENILLAYRNIKKNTGSNTMGTDGRTIRFLSDLTNTELIELVRRELSNYRPKPVRRVYIPKPNGSKRPLGIPTIIDRLIQQCILQVLEPICEAKFYKYSFGFRPNRSTRNAIARAYALAQINKLEYCIDIDIKGFFDNVNHAKLIKQMWSLGIRDKRLISIISKMLKTEIKGEGVPTKGTPQGGILSPLLSNIVLNELDWWIASQWDELPTIKNYCNKGNKQVSLRQSSRIKEMHIVRYADDFKIYCRDRVSAIKTFHAVRKWLKDRLSLDISDEKSKIVNLKKEYSEFLGIKMKLKYWNKRWTISSNITDKSKSKIISDIKHQLKKIRKYDYQKYVYDLNSMILGYHQYYNMATLVNIDFHKINHIFYRRFKNKLMNTSKGTTPKYFEKLYGKYKFKPIYLRNIRIIPLDGVKFMTPLQMKKGVNLYTKKGRELIHKELEKDKLKYLKFLLENTIKSETTEYNDNRISLYVGQQGKCFITKEILTPNNMHCHHKIPRNLNGTDEYSNLVFVIKNIHQLIHSSKVNTIKKYLNILSLDKLQLDKINKLRIMANLNPITDI